MGQMRNMYVLLLFYMLFCDSMSVVSSCETRTRGKKCTAAETLFMEFCNQCGKDTRMRTIPEGRKCDTMRGTPEGRKGDTMRGIPEERKGDTMRGTPEGKKDDTRRSKPQLDIATITTDIMMIYLSLYVSTPTARILLTVNVIVIVFVIVFVSVYVIAFTGLGLEENRSRRINGRYVYRALSFEFTKSKTECQIEDSIIKSAVEYSTGNRRRKSEDSFEIFAETEKCSTEFKEGEQGLIVSDCSDCNESETPLPTEKGDENMAATNTKRLSFGNKGRGYIMKRYGVLNKASRYKMLLLCRKKAREEGNRRFGGHLKKSTEMFTGTSWNTGKVGYKALCRLVVDRIPEDDWMEFVRMYLNLKETEIQSFRGKYCVFNKEQKRQILEDF